MSTDLLSCLSSVSCRGAGTSDEKNSSAVEVRGNIARSAARQAKCVRMRRSVQRSPRIGKGRDKGSTIELFLEK